MSDNTNAFGILRTVDNTDNTVSGAEPAIERNLTIPEQQAVMYLNGTKSPLNQPDVHPTGAGKLEFELDVISSVEVMLTPNGIWLSVNGIPYSVSGANHVLIRESRL